MKREEGGRKRDRDGGRKEMKKEMDRRTDGRGTERGGMREGGRGAQRHIWENRLRMSNCTVR